MVTGVNKLVLAAHQILILAAGSLGPDAQLLLRGLLQCLPEEEDLLNLLSVCVFLPEQQL